MHNLYPWRRRTSFSYQIINSYSTLVPQALLVPSDRMRRPLKLRIAVGSVCLGVIFSPSKLSLSFPSFSLSIDWTSTSTSDGMGVCFPRNVIHRPTQQRKGSFRSTLGRAYNQIDVTLATARFICHWNMYRAPLIGRPQVSRILFLLLLTTSGSTCLQHSRNLGPAY